MTRDAPPRSTGSPPHDDAVWRADHDRVRGPAPQPQPEPYGGEQAAVRDEPAGSADADADDPDDPNHHADP